MGGITICGVTWNFHPNSLEQAMDASMEPSTLKGSIVLELYIQIKMEKLTHLS